MLLEILVVMQGLNNNIVVLYFQVLITGALGIPGTRREPSTLRNVFVSMTV